MRAFERIRTIIYPGRTNRALRCTEFYLVQFHSVPLCQILSDSGYLLSSVDCRLCICSFAHPLRRLYKCFSRASDVSSQHVRAHASPSSSRSPRHSRRLLQIAQIVPPNAESSMAWNCRREVASITSPLPSGAVCCTPTRVLPHRGHSPG
jgi:hypothetical protein